MRVYEGMFLVDNSEARKDYEGVSGNIASIITKNGGEVIRSERWAERRLAYTIRRRDRGTYILVYFNAHGEAITQIKRDCMIDEVILRTMILGVEAVPEKEAEPVEQAKPDAVQAKPGETAVVSGETAAAKPEPVTGEQTGDAVQAVEGERRRRTKKIPSRR